LVVMCSTNIEEPKTYLKCDNICKPMHKVPQLTKFKMFFIRLFYNSDTQSDEYKYASLLCS